jgi:hypothetical protein
LEADVSAEPITPHAEMSRGRLGDDRGYVLALGALLILPLFIAVGFSVDVGSWYARASELQRAADAASLAGVVHLPDTAAAQAAAQATLNRNGFTDTDGDGTVDGTDTRIVMGVVGSQRFRVRLVDRDVDLFFSSVLLDGMEIRRQAIAEYVLPVAMGSPRNFLGTGGDPCTGSGCTGAIPDTLHENFWLAASGPCASREQGEYLGAVSDANFLSSGFQCTGGSVFDATTTTYDPDGYFYAIEIPAGAAGNTLYLDVYDGAQCTTFTPNNTGDSAGGSDDSTTHMRLLGPDNNPYEPTDNPLLSDPIPGGFITNNAGQCAAVSGISSGGYRAGWRRLFTQAGVEPGIYFIQVETEKVEDNNGQNGTNQFSFRASYNSVWTNPGSACSSDPAETTYYNANCPQLYGIEWMGVYANITTGNLFLAEIGDEHSGKQMVVNLWDTGEGALTIELLDPEGNSVSFDWQVINLSGSDTAPAGGWSGSVTQAGGGAPCSGGAGACASLNVSGSGLPQPGPNRLSTSRYNDRRLRFVIQLPDDIEAEYGGLTWWKVRYGTSGAGSSTDRTTWSVTVEGDPVKLIE